MLDNLLFSQPHCLAASLFSSLVMTGGKSTKFSVPFLSHSRETEFLGLWSLK
jgi:hypothetical protein